MSIDHLTKKEVLAAILLATPEALQELLQLPEGAYIDSVYSPHDRPGTLELRIRGAGWPCNLGQSIPRTTATVTLQRDAEGRELARVVDWGLPGSHEARQNWRTKMEEQATAEMPRYKCHKEVHALKIKDIEFEANASLSGLPLGKD